MDLTVIRHKAVSRIFCRHAALERRAVQRHIGLARQELRRALDTLDYRNLDGEARFRGANTTTEFLAAHIHGLLAAALRDGRFGPGGAAVAGLKVTLRESPNAWAAFEGPVEDPPPLFGAPGA